MKYFLAMWSIEGFECILDITEYQYDEAANTARLLAGEEPEKSQLDTIVSGMKMRARFNPQRNYEVYSFAASAGIGQAEIDNWMATDPQSLADWLRANGTAIVKKLPATKQLIQ